MSTEYDRIAALAKNNVSVVGAMELIDAENIIDKELAQMRKDVLVEIFITGYLACMKGE